MEPQLGEAGPTLASYLRVLQRRSWVVLLAALITPATALLLSFQQQAKYEASAEVLLSRQDLASALTGTGDLTRFANEERDAATQAALAQVPEVARRTLRSAGASDMTAQDLLDASSVGTKSNADILVFRVTDSTRDRAQQLATAYAEQFVAYRAELDTAALKRARREVRRKLEALNRSGGRGGKLYDSLQEKEQQLATIETLQTARAYVVRRPDRAEQIAPRPIRNGALGLVLGLLLGGGLAFLAEALDTRVRSTDELRERLGMPLLARLPAPPRKLQKENRLVMLAQPSGIHAEAFRMLRTNLDFASLDRDVKTILVTSAIEQEGKSTTAANLAIALARAGKRVVLADLDLRRPFAHRYFDVPQTPGLTGVVLGAVGLDEALTPIVLSERPGASNQPSGSLEVLPTGPVPPDPGELIATRRVGDLLEELRWRADVVLVDSPPLLRVGDTMALSTRVDGILVVSRLSLVRRGMLAELRRALDTAPAVKLGFVVTDAELEEGVYGYAYGYGHDEAHRARAERAPDAT